MRSHLVFFGFLAVAAFVTLSVSSWADEPAPRLEGFWTWRWEDQEGTVHKHVLNVERAGDKLAASERFDESEPVEVEELKVKGKEISFVVPRGELRATYFGKIASNDTINGEVQVRNAAGQVEKYGWTAKRQPKGETP